ncbi:ciliary microtubule inner protein 2C [Microcebus murinus]|uniref:Ciliary microtubule inner protein 2C n=1 Tax=Microcebus murinus TaxID=30608 RepID=A0A8C5Y8J1_MICMU|nr:UPF0573 protein C2orf70 homolog [Microcebus murinus]
MASRSAGTLLTEFNAAYVPPSLMPGYHGHVPGLAFSFGSPYGTTTFNYFQRRRNAAMEHSKGGHFPTLSAPNPDLMLTDDRLHIRDHSLRTPCYTRFNLDGNRAGHLTHFYQMVQQQRKYYRDKTGTMPQVSYFVLPMTERDRYPLPTHLPPLSLKNKWNLLRVSPENLRTYQTFPSGKRVSPQERRSRDCYFEFRA